MRQKNWHLYMWVFLKQVKWVLVVGFHPQTFFEPYLSHTWSSLRFFFVWRIISVYRWEILRNSCCSWLMETLCKLLSGILTLRNLLWSLNIDSFLLLYLLLSVAITQLPVYNFWIIKFVIFIRFFKATNSSWFKCCRTISL